MSDSEELWKRLDREWKQSEDGLAFALWMLFGCGLGSFVVGALIGGAQGSIAVGFVGIICSGIVGLVGQIVISCRLVWVKRKERQ